MNKYILKKQDTFNKLIVNDFYYIDEKNFNKLYNKNLIFTGYVLTEWQKNNMFFKNKIKILQKLLTFYSLSFIIINVGRS